MIRPGVDGPPVLLCVDLVDFRKSISGLSLIVEQSLELNPFEVALYVFINRKRDKLKILYWEKNGFCLGYKSPQQERYRSAWGISVSFKAPIVSLGNSIVRHNWSVHICLCNCLPSFRFDRYKF